MSSLLIYISLKKEIKWCFYIFIAKTKKKKQTKNPIKSAYNQTTCCRLHASPHNQKCLSSSRFYVRGYIYQKNIFFIGPLLDVLHHWHPWRLVWHFSCKIRTFSPLSAELILFQIHPALYCSIILVIIKKANIPSLYLVSYEVCVFDRHP